MSTKRIIDLPVTTDISADDYVMLDGATNSTRKYPLKAIVDEIEDIERGAGLNDGAVGTDAIASGAVTNAKLATDSVGTSNIQNGSVTLEKIASGSEVTTSSSGLMSATDKAKLDEFSAASSYALKSDIVGAYIFKGSVANASDLPVTGMEVGHVYNIINASVYGSAGTNVAWNDTEWDALGEAFEIADGSITTDKLASASVTASKLANQAVGTDKIEDGAVTNVKLADDAVSISKIADGAVVTSKIANSTITTDKIADVNVTTAKLANGGVTTDKIADGGVTTVKIADGGITTAKIADGSVTHDKLGDDVTAEFDDIHDELDSKADTDGYYSQLTAGLAENLIGRGDAVPAEYLYRTAGGTPDISDGIATIDCIKGNTLVWNQYINVEALQENASTIQNIGNTWKATALDSATRFFGIKLFWSGVVVVGHKYLVLIDVDTSALTSFYKVIFSHGGFTTTLNGSESVTESGRLSFIYEAHQASTMSGYVNVSAKVGETIAGQEFSISNPQLFDLTLMFGAGNEPETVEEFEAMFPLPYYPYSAPKLLNVDMRGVETVGFNLLPNVLDWNNAASYAFDKKDAVRLIAGQSYQFTLDSASASSWLLAFKLFDMDGNLLTSTRLADYLTINSSNLYNFYYNGSKKCYNEGGSHIYKELPFTPLKNMYIVMLCNVSLVNPCLHLVWSGYRDGEYEPYWKNQRPINISQYFPNGMRSAGNENATYPAIRDELTNDTAITRVGYYELDQNTPIWVSDDSHQYGPCVRFGISSLELPVSARITCAEATSHASVVAICAGPNRISTLMGVEDRLYFSLSESIETVDDAKEYLAQHPWHIFYTLKTPVVTPIDPPLNLSYKVSDFGTERIMVDETADAPQSAPVPMDVEYGLNAIDTIRRLPTNYIPRDELEPKLDEKADVDGYYSTMTVGAADNLTGRGDGVTAEYLYRTAGGDEDIADGVANIRSIKGQTLVWNQIVAYPYASRNVTEQNGITYTLTEDGRYLTAAGDSTAAGSWVFNGYKDLGLTAGHKYALTGTDEIRNIALRVYSRDTEISHFSSSTQSKGIFTVSDTAHESIVYLQTMGVRTGVSYKGAPQLFDLTLMFGAGNEPATIEEFEALFPKPYYPYSEPTLLSVNMHGIETVGFNQWDEEWELGGFTSTGEETASSKRIRSKNYIPIVGGMDYYFHIDSKYNYSSWIAFHYYDADKNWISYTSSGDGITRRTPANARYLRFSTSDGWNGVPYSGGFCINLRWSGYRNGEYEEYWNFQRTIPAETYFPDGMRSAGSVADELTPSKAIKRIGVVDLGTLSWSVNSTNSVWAPLSTIAASTSNVACASLVYSSQGVDTAPMNSVRVTSSSTIVVKMDGINRDNALAMLSGVMLYYALAEPTEVTIEPPLNLSYKVSDFGTEKVMVDEEADAPQSAPPTIQVAYGINATDTVRRLPTQYISHESFQQFVAALQSAVGITVTETWDETDGRYEYTVTQTGE